MITITYDQLVTRGAWGWTPSQYALVIWTDANGFVNHRVLNETQYNDLVEVCS
jgi:hypothetical protein